MVASATLMAAPARGEDVRRVELKIVSCPFISDTEVRRLIGIEIGDVLVGDRELAPPDADQITIRCEGEVERIEAAGAVRAQPLSRTILFADFPGDAAPRALALAAIEVLAALSPALRQRLEVHGASAPEGTEPHGPHGVAATGIAREASTAVPPGVKSQAKETKVQPLKDKVDGEKPQRTHSGPATPPSPPTPLVWRVGASGLFRWFPTLGASAAGGKIEVDSEFPNNWELAFDLEAFGESKAVTLGSARALFGSVGAFAGFGGPGTRRAVAVGGRLGVAHLEGDPPASSAITGAQVVRPWAGPAIALRGFVQSGPLSLELSAEAGVALWHAEGLASGSAELGASGMWLSLSAGPGVRVAR
jgi:hypothetical protein